MHYNDRMVKVGEGVRTCPILSQAQPHISAQSCGAGHSNGPVADENGRANKTLQMLRLEAKKHLVA